MKLPSLQKLRQATVEVTYRFPLEIFCAVIGTSLSLWLIEREKEPEEYLWRLVLCSVLGLALFLSTTVYTESRGFSKKKRSLLQGLVVLVLMACWFAIKPIESETSIIRYALFAIAFHLLVSCAPKTTLAGFWEYNKQLFIRILTAQLYSWVLYAGLCIAIVSSDFLFNLNVDSKIYFHLYVLILGLFNTIFFLAGVPDKFEKLEQQYPKGLKVFTQYVLIPLATIYLFIILAYEVKVIFEWSLPEGIISWLILGYGVYGILSILLVYPVRVEEENKWISTFSKLFYFLLIPLLPLLFLAIGLRAMDYGVTELRYLVIVLALWLTGITIYFLLSKTQNIKIIPVTLAVLALLSAWGPQSASSVSEQSQVKRLIQLFQSQNSFKNGVLQPMPDTITDSIGNETISQLNFVVGRYSSKALHKILPSFIKDSLQRIDIITNRYSKKYAVQEVLRKSLALKEYYAKSSHIQYYDAIANDDSIAVNNYRYLKSFTFYEQGSEKNSVLRGDSLIIKIKNDSFIFKISKVISAIERQQEKEGVEYPNLIPAKEMTIETLNAKNAQLLINKIHYRKDSNTLKLEQLEALILYKD